jgi:photosystem II stability/assembly factor-like uncharacterized protein
VIVAPPPANAAAFVDANHGWVGGGGGLLGTDDGRTFRLEVRAPIVGISALTRHRVWALAGDGFVLRTTDGRSWSRLGAPHLVQMQFVTARVGFGLTRDGVLVRSGDAGTSWRESPRPGLVQSECFSSPANGWVARGGSVWTTHDAGRRWTRVRLRSGAQELPQLDCRSRDAWVVLHEGAAAGTEGYHVYRSLGGGPWRAVLASPFQRKLPSISNYAGPFSVLGRGRAVFSGSCAACGPFGTLTTVRTVDGGASFQRGNVIRGYQPQALSFTDPNAGWLVTGGHAGSASAVRLGILWRTRDGGRHWNVVLRSPVLRSS